MKSVRISALIPCLLLLCFGRANGQCTAGFQYTVRNGAHPLEVAFTNTSTGGNFYHYFWNFGDGRPGANTKDPLHEYEYPGEYLVTLVILNQNMPCNDTITRRICVRCVLPGDANNDSTINNNDVLYLGISFGAVGPVRSTGTAGGPSYPWLHSNGLANFNSGVNLQYSDCDGSGVIDRQDLTVIEQYYHATASGVEPAECTDINAVPLYFAVPDSIPVGTAVSVEVHLGTSQIPATEIYGIAFSVNYDSELIEPGSLSFDYSASLLGTPADLISIDKDNGIASRVETAVTRIDQAEQTVAGKIGTLNFVMEENLAQKTYLTAILNLSFSDITLIKVDETVVPVCAFIDSAVVYEKLLPSGNGAVGEKKIRLYPNPANDFIKVDLSASGAYEITVLNLLGKQLIHDSGSGENYTLNTALFARGVYLLSVRNATSLQTFRFEIER